MVHTENIVGERKYPIPHPSWKFGICADRVCAEPAAHGLGEERHRPLTDFLTRTHIDAILFREWDTSATRIPSTSAVGFAVGVSAVVYCLGSCRVSALDRFPNGCKIKNAIGQIHSTDFNDSRSWFDLIQNIHIINNCFQKIFDQKKTDFFSVVEFFFWPCFKFGFEFSEFERFNVCQKRKVAAWRSSL